MRLLTFNALIRGDVRARLRALAEILRESDFDVVCLQEVMYRSHANLLRRGFAHSACAGSVVLKGGLVLLSRRPIKRWRFVRFPMTGPVRPEFLMRKGALVAEIDELVIVNTHLSANRDDDWSPDNRYALVERAELDVLARLLAGIDKDRPLVVTGDLNLPRDASALADFRTAAGLADAMAGDRRPTYRPTPQWPHPPAFDHLLVRGGITAHADLVLCDEVTLPGGRRVYLSDHYGVAADIRPRDEFGFSPWTDGPPRIP
ncbi:endonuclease/exonuclease/phosphatase family protein [Actinoplanes oblitus]|uniref:Endonuclease/exonuclease/phosphatase family protein n=1 Tax=Actinoplanes oblitus TaxID=3040509 RepID=A0ABY8WLE0_9ACTN|nr:endonuclease/exonuclease/phosphatase family protein [Actinoplanes oblitus]WIM98709.1 endonuclease/exonuclease/phosphatase family protein [Actinoplanes oblitus]